MEELWADIQTRQILLGLGAMLIISIAKRFSEYAAQNTGFKYGAVVVLSIVAAALSQLWTGTVIEWPQLLNSTIHIGIAAIAGHQTVGKLAAAILNGYTLRKNGK